MRLSAKDYFSIPLAGNDFYDFYAGSRWIGRMHSSAPFSLLHAVVTNLDDVERFGLTCVFAGGAKVLRVDVQEFLERFGSKTGLLQRMYAGVAPGIWQLHAFRPQREQIGADFGIVLPASLASGASFRIFCNETPESDRIVSLDRSFSSSHWFAPSGSVMAFRSIFPMPVSKNWVRFSIEFEGEFSGANRHFRDHWNLTDLDMIVGLPDLRRIQRVASKNANAMSFLNGGKTAFERLVRIALDHGIDVRDAEVPVLDWGVGCGRIAMHFNSDTKARLTGIDIDVDNVEWCRNNLQGDYRVVPPAPPTDLEPSLFRLIYACSVLSHLSEKDANLWLAEIARLLAPDGVALLSYNGTSNAISYLSRRPGELDAVFSGDLFDKDVNSELKGFIPSDSYYRQGFSSDAWWLETFKRHFNVVAIELSVVSGFQHIAVLRKK